MSAMHSGKTLIPPLNKNHNRQKMFRIGISVGRNDLNVEGHLQMGYSSKTIRNYRKRIETQPVHPQEQRRTVKNKTP